MQTARALHEPGSNRVRRPRKEVPMAIDDTTRNAIGAPLAAGDASTRLGA